MKKYPVAKHLLISCFKKILVSDVPQYIKLEIIYLMRNFDLDDIIGFLEQNLQSGNEEIKTNTIETMGHFKERAIKAYLEPFLDSADFHITSAAIIGLWNFRELRLNLIMKMVKMLTFKEKEAVDCMLNLIGSVDAKWEKAYVYAQLRHGDQHIRTHALLALIRLGENDKYDDLVRVMSSLARSENQAELEFVLSKYRHFNDRLKQIILNEIRGLAPREIGLLYDAFRKSKYVFEYEMDQLS